jgi:uncharacterized repeat protein (TIGR01451 family)
VWVSLAGIAALLFAAGLLLPFSRSQAAAQPALEVTAADLQATKSVYPDWARPGQYLTYTVHVVNSGDTLAESAWMTDGLPSEVNYTSGLTATGGSLGIASNTITWTGSISPAETAVITFVVQISPSVSGGTHFTNTATITGAGSLVQASVGATAVTTFYLYFPLVPNKYPPVPVLNSIPAPDANSAYVVSWSCDATGTDRYVLQESTDANFTNVTRMFTTTSTSQLVQQGSSYGCTLYYRVRVDDDDRWGQGPWSNVRSVTTCYFDDFSNPASGWPSFDVLVIPSTDTHYRGRYENGQYRIMVDAGGPQIWFHQPDALTSYRPATDRFCLEADVRFMKQQPPYEPWNFYPYWANGGVIFGASEDNKDLYIMCLAVGASRPDHSADMGWYLMHNPSNQWPYEGCHSSASVGGESGGLNTENWYNFKIGVDGDQVTVYISGAYKGVWTMPGLSGTTRLGVTGGPYEVTPVDLRFDNFRVIPNAACTP